MSVDNSLIELVKSNGLPNIGPLVEGDTSVARALNEVHLLFLVLLSFEFEDHCNVIELASCERPYEVGATVPSLEQ